MEEGEGGKSCAIPQIYMWVSVVQVLTLSIHSVALSCVSLVLWCPTPSQDSCIEVIEGSYVSQKVHPGHTGMRRPAKQQTSPGPHGKASGVV